jgi:hypothetical protein
MSTKTTFKRVALVAVASMGFGVLTSVAPASATAGQEIAVTELTGLTIEGNASNVTITQREDVATGSTNLSVGYVIDATATADDGDEISLYAAFTSRPAASTLTNASLTFGATATNVAADATPGTAGDATATAGTGSTAAKLLVEQDGGAGADTLVTDASVGEFAFTPDTPGTYVVRIWHDANANLLWDAAEATRLVTVNAGAAPATMTVAQFGATTSVDGTSHDTLEDGSLAVITFKDAAGNATTLGAGEGVTITASGSATIVTSAGSAAGTDGTTLTSSITPNAFGQYVVNFKNSVAQISTITMSGAGNLAGVIAAQTLSFEAVAVVDEDAAPATNAMTTGTDATNPGSVATLTATGTGDAIAVSSGTKTVTLTFTSAAASTTARYVGVNVYDVTGAITGVVGAAYTDVVAISGTAAGTATKSWTATYWSATSRARTGAAAADTFNVVTLDLSGTIDDGLGGLFTATAAANNATNSAFNITSVSAVAAGAVSVTLTLKDQFGLVRAGQAVTFVIAGRNAANTAVRAAVTSATGEATFSYTDIGTATSAVTDTITVSGLAVTGVTVTFGATNAVETVKVDSGDTTAGVANLFVSPKDIAAGLAGAAAGKQTVTATVTNAAGVALAGVPVTFTVAGTGCAVPSNDVTEFTSALGVATSSVYAWIAGKCTITATAGAKTGTGVTTFRQESSSEIRTLSGSVAGTVVTAAPKDRFGNSVVNGTVYAVITAGNGYFGSNGARTATLTTDGSGTATVVVAGGDATVKLTTINPAGTGLAADQSTAAAGNHLGDVATPVVFTATTVGTTTTAETGVGASFSAAGVSSATVEVTGDTTSQSAADAAAEATDAANAATDAANAAAEAADAATAAAQDAADAVAALSTQVSEMVNALKKQITALTNLVIKIQKKVKA